MVEEVIKLRCEEGFVVKKVKRNIADTRIKRWKITGEGNIMHKALCQKKLGIFKRMMNNIMEEIGKTC